MLINWHAPRHIYLVCGKTDLRKGIDGLAIVIAENYGLELYDDSLFLFCGFRNDRLRVYIGTAKALSYFINAMKMVISNGHELPLKPAY